MFFLIGFGWHVAASFAFLVAILNPNWITLQTVTTTGIVTVQRDVFYVCYLVAQDATYQTTQCASIINLDSSINSPIWKYNLAISSASIAIGCAGLSIIVLWLAGIYFNVRKKTNCTSCLLLFTFLLLILTFCASVAVWILLISETLALGYTVNRSIINWPMWLAIGASGGFLMALITLLISFCKSACGQRKRDKNLYYASNQY